MSASIQSWSSVRIEKAGHEHAGTGGVALKDSYKREGDDAEVVDVKLDVTGQVETFAVADVRVL